MKIRLFILLIFLLISLSMLYSKTPTLYVVTRSTKTFKLGSQDNPTVGLFSTGNNGKTWRHYGWKYTKCFSGAKYDSKNESIFYLACGNGILKSDAKGKRWKITTGWNITECLKVVVDPKNRNIVYAATAYGIFKTVDGGKRWDEKNIGLISTFTPTLIIDTKNSSRMIFS